MTRLEQQLAASAQSPPWWSDPANLARLLRWMYERDHESFPPEAEDVFYYLEKPWKWEAEWKQMTEPFPHNRDEDLDAWRAEHGD